MGNLNPGGDFARGVGRRPKGTYNKDKPFKQMLQKKLLSAGSDPSKLEKIADKVIEMAQAGDIEAIREIANRLDGYPVRPIANEGDVPMFLNVSWRREPVINVQPGDPPPLGDPLRGSSVLIEEQQIESHDPEPVDHGGNGRSGEPE
jgi:hypothetical protein